MRNLAIAVVLATLLGTGIVHAADGKGKVTGMDPADGTVTLKHGAIKALDMDAMTMGYRVADPRLLDGIKVGDHVVFDVGGADGDYTVTRLRKVR